MSIYGHTAIFVETPILHRLAPHVGFASQDPHEAVYLGFGLDWFKGKKYRNPRLYIAMENPL